MPIACAGSSPRVRGTRSASSREHASRFIPACAGNAGAEGGADVVRFIPACAGNAGRRRRHDCRTPVHPRVCGERAIEAQRRRTGSGSSPRVRGTRDQLSSPVKRLRGSSPRVRGTRRWTFRHSSLTVHPRVCGERSSVRRRRADRFGSSPRVRGTRRNAYARRRQRVRFIPACAGNAAVPRSSSSNASAGSSPRVRGTLRSSVLPVRRPVHPRVCGERRLAAAPAQTPNRFIPACAGNAAA